MKKTVIDPEASAALVPELRATRRPEAWVYRYEHPSGWRLSIATHAEPGSAKLSLGGFRIVPQERASAGGFDTDVEAIELAMGMEEKVYWSRLMGIGGPLARRDIKRIVGGKCVLLPTPDARIGQPRDRDLLDFAIECLRDCDRTAGIHITTGQDLGHGTMSDGRTTSLQYLNRGFRGSVVADTSKPTGEGNYFVLVGMLRAFGLSLRGVTIGLIGAGNIGMHIAERVRAQGAPVFAVELRQERRAQLETLGVTAWPPGEKMTLLATPVDALVVTASGGSLDTGSVRAAAANSRLKVVCGSENLVMPEPGDAEILRAARKSYCPTELGGMMGYLTAVEEYLADLDGVPFDVTSLVAAAVDLEEPAYQATKRMIDSDFEIDFGEAVQAISA
ncbi:MAG: NAD(P)-dependent oxidoreductase [Gemmatimonadaceae bacterium]